MTIKGLHKYKKKSWKKSLFQQLVCPPGGTAVVDAFCWLHDCGCYLGRLLYQSPAEGRARVTQSFLELVEIVRSSGGRHKWVCHLVFDGAPSPAKANEDALRQNRRKESLDKALALERAHKGTSKVARSFYNAWWRPSYELVHHICVELTNRCIPFTVAPHEADGQVSYLCNKGAPGTTIAITKDSDLAVTSPLVFFWDKQYDNEKRLGGGLLCNRREMLSKMDGKQTMVGFSDRQFLLVCVLCGCDYVSKEDHATQLGFQRAVGLVREQQSLEPIIQYVMSCGKYKVTPNTPQATRAAVYQFDHAVVFDRATGSHVNRTPIPPEERDKIKAALGGNMRLLGDVWPSRVAIDMANSVVHPLTRLPFAVPPTNDATVPRGGQRSRRTVLIGGRIEDSLRIIPAPAPLPPGPEYNAALHACGVTEQISPNVEIPESILVKVLQLREQDVPSECARYQRVVCVYTLTLFKRRWYSV